MNLVIGVDPGTGLASPTGFVCIDADTRTIEWAENVGSKHKPLEHRIKEISEVIEMYFVNLAEALGPKDKVTVCIESFVMRGKGGETLQRLIGSLMGRVPYNFEVVHMPNTRMKNLVGGTGKADKQQVAEGVLEWFGDAELGTACESYRAIKSLISLKEWDILDALALAIAAHEMKDQ